jgi:uncharacterized membrane protein
MKSKAVVAGHAVHPMLVVFPLGLLVTSIVWDVAALVSKNPTWGTIAYWTILAGVVGALVAAVPGFIDWLAIPRGTRARALGFMHMCINLVLVALFAISLLARANAAGGYQAAGFVHMVWGWLGIGLATISSWMGGELVETLGISVRAGANPDAPSSLGRGKEPPRLPPSVPRRPTPLPRGH